MVILSVKLLKEPLILFTLRCLQSAPFTKQFLKINQSICRWLRQANAGDKIKKGKINSCLNKFTCISANMVDRVEIVRRYITDNNTQAHMRAHTDVCTHTHTHTHAYTHTYTHHTHTYT